MLLENEQVGLKRKKEPDGMIQSSPPVDDRYRPSTFMALECAVWNESLEELALEALEWHDGGALASAGSSMLTSRRRRHLYCVQGSQAWNGQWVRPPNSPSTCL